MKFESLPSIFYIISVLVPGFIYNGVISNLMPLRRAREREALLLRFLTATAFNYALASPLIYLLTFRIGFAVHPFGEAFGWFFIIFVLPIVLAVINAWFLQSGRLARLVNMLGLRFINPIPTGWDWIFSTTAPCYILITLADGTEIAGYFGSESMASSDPEHKDIYIERVYTIPGDGGPWLEVERSLGMHVDGSQIAYIEFRE